MWNKPTFRLALNKAASDGIAWHCKPWHCKRSQRETLLEDAELRSPPIRQGQKRLCLYSMRGWTEYSAAVRLHLCVEMLMDSVSSKDARNQQPAQHPSRANRQCSDPWNSLSCGVADACTESASLEKKGCCQCAGDKLPEFSCSRQSRGLDRGGEEGQMAAGGDIGRCRRQRRACLLLRHRGVPLGAESRSS